MVSLVERRSLVALEQYSTAPLFNTKAVARQTGVPAPTLRAWERRYGILTPQRGSNAYRLYSERDIAMVRWLREQVESGLTISQAIAVLHNLSLLDTASARRQDDLAAHPQAARELTRQELSEGPAPMQAAAGLAGQFSTLADELLEACIRLDEAAAQRVLASLFALFGVEQAIAAILQPMLIDMGTRWEAGDLSITVEHFATTMIRGRLDALYQAQAAPIAGPLVLVGCAPGEQHELGALMLALLLRRQHPGLRVIYLGQNVEAAHLLETIQTQRPAVVCLSATLPEHRQAIAALARHIAALPPLQRPVLVYGGRAFAEVAEEIEGVFLGTQAMQSIAPIIHFCTHRPLFNA